MESKGGEASAFEQALEWNSEGGRRLKQGDHGGALECFAAALSSFGQSLENSLIERAGVRNNMGHVFVTIGDYSNARKFFEGAAQLFREIGDEVGLAWQLTNQGSVYRDEGRSDKALEKYKSALELFLQQSNPNAVADQYANIAYIFYMKKDHERALEIFQMAHAAYKALDDDERVAMVEKNIAAIMESFR